MNVLILMAGEGRRFVDAGIDIPKPLIEVNGKTILEWTTRSLPFIKHYDEEGDHAPSDRLYFAIRNDHESHDISNKLQSIYGNDINIISFAKTTRGNLETAYVSVAAMDSGVPLLVLDCDNKYTSNNMSSTFNEALSLDNSMVVSYFEPIDDSTKWAFVFTDGSIVTDIVEKDPHAIEQGGKPLVGTFWFSSTDLFMSCADFIIRNELRVGAEGKEEFYLSQVPAFYVQNGGAVFVHKVTDVVPLGTPEDVEQFKCGTLHI